MRRPHVPAQVVHHAVDLAADGARRLPRVLLHVHLARVRVAVAFAADGAGEPGACRQKEWELVMGVVVAIVEGELAIGVVVAERTVRDSGCISGGGWFVVVAIVVAGTLTIGVLVYTSVWWSRWQLLL